MEKNIYIKAMEIGYNAKEDINYFHLKEKVQKDLNIKIEKVREYTLAIWFLNNFETWDIPKRESNPAVYHRIINGIRHHTKGEPGDNNSNTITFESTLSKPYYMRGETVKQYLDYLELKESREQAQNAQRTSIFAILIAIVTLLISIYFSATTPKPPYDVNVLEKPVPLKDIISPNDGMRSVYPDNKRDAL